MRVKDTESVAFLKLKNYKFPANESVEFKGVVFFIHGFTDYVARFAHIALEFSQMGYDFYGMDQRGHGQSEGKTIHISSMDQITDDTISYHRMVLDQFYQKTSPPSVNIIAHSMGCMQVLNMLMRSN
jgi:alpha-beta hydrolase superfamily lysophospholipase